MRFLCVCLAPAIDATVRLNRWPTDGAVIKDATETVLPGGKALNVARWLAKRGADVACAGVLGTDNTMLFEQELARYGIEDRFLRVPGATRVNEMFVTPAGSFKVNRPASWAFEGLEGLERFKGFDVVILSGGLPRGWPDDTYRVLTESARTAGARVVLDTSGPALIEGVKGCPDVIKPNAEECAALVGFVPKTSDDFNRATAALRASSGFPIISDGAAGCWFDGLFVPAPKVDVLDTTAAGDTLLAEWCWRRYVCDEDVVSCARGAVAAGSAACTMPGGTPPSADFVKRIAKDGRGERI